MRNALRASSCGLVMIIAAGAVGGATGPQALALPPAPAPAVASAPAMAPAPAVAPASTAKPDVFTTTISVSTSGRVAGAISDHYAGLSFESGTLNAGHFDAAGNLPQLLRNLGPSVMRFGGLTVDDGSFPGITPDSLAGLARLAKASGWTVLYSEDLGHYHAAAVTADAKAVATALGPSLSAFACGNEPNGYAKSGRRPPGYTIGDYLKEAAGCLAAIRAGAPRAPLEGADLTGAADWLAPYVRQESGKLAFVGEHLYQAGCRKDYTGVPALQVDAKLLSPALVTREIGNFTWLVADAKIARARPIMSETNSICSGGLAGVSDTYAAALWAIDYMLTGAEHGVTGMNFHDRFTASCTPYSALCPVPGRPDEYTVRPIYYGMLFTHLLGSGRLVPVTVRTGTPDDHVAAFALRPATGGWRIIVENLTAEHANVSLGVGGHPASAKVVRLTAPGLTATSGVKIQGATVHANGAFKPGAPTVTKCSSGKCELTLTPYTAALITIAG